MLTELWDKYKGKALVFLITTIIGVPAVGGFTGMTILSEDDGCPADVICIGFADDAGEEAPAE